MTTARLQGQARRPLIDIEAMRRLTEIADYIVPFAIRVVCDLAVADTLRAGPRAVEDIARLTNTHADSLRRVLRALASRGVFAEVQAGTFALTPLAETLRSDHPNSLQKCFPLMPPDIHSWANIDHTIRTGDTAFDHVHGESYYEYFAQRPADSVRFDRSVQSVNPMVLRTTLSAVDWSRFSSVVDVGGGNGSFVAGVLRHVDTMRAVLVDLPHVVKHAAGVLVQHDVSERCEIVAGDFFSTLPAGYDCYLLKTVLHDWDDERAARLLTVVRAAMRPDSRVVVIESVRRHGNEFDVGKLMDVKAMVLFGGHARTQDGFASLFEAAGLRIDNVTSTPTMSVLEAEAV